MERLEFGAIKTQRVPQNGDLSAESINFGEVLGELFAIVSDPSADSSGIFSFRTDLRSIVDAVDFSFET